MPAISISNALFVCPQAVRLHSNLPARPLNVPSRSRVVCKVSQDEKVKQASKPSPSDKSLQKSEQSQSRPSNKIVQAPTLGDRLENGITNVLNVTAIPAGLTVLALALPGIWIYRLYDQLTKEPMAMRDKVVVIAGASSGIGEHIAYEYGQLGARLALIARRKEKLEAVEKEARLMGSPDVHVISSDLSSEEGCKKAVESAVQHFGTIDVLVCNAGAFQSYLFDDVKETDGFQPIMDINFWSYVYLTHYALPSLKKSQGQIVVTASVSSFVPQPRNTLYNATKAAVVNFFHTLRIELADRVHVTMFSPGLTKSEMTDGRSKRPDGSMPEAKDAKKLRNKQFGLYPTVPVTRLAREAVKAARMKKYDVTIPSWYTVFQPYRLFAPEVLDNFFYWFLARDKTVNEEVLEALGVQAGQPSEKDYEESGVPKGGKR